MRPVQPLLLTALSRRTSSALVSISALLCLSAQAQERVLEEVIVTSQKRAQSLQDVPNSVAAVTGDKMERMGVENLEDLTAYVPNIHFTETGLSTQVRIRGIGSDNSQGFEQSVGVYMDGIHRGRAQLFRAPIFDMERVEVMRGPQGTLFGKNSIAGALDLITAKPTDELEGRISGSYEMEYGTREISGFISGPLNETLKGRIAMRYYDDPGFMVNTFKNTDEPDQDERAVRATLDWTPLSNLDILLTVERDTFDVQGRPSETTLDQPAPGGPSYGQVLANFPGGDTFESDLDYRRQANAPEFSENTIDSQTLRIDYTADNFTLTSLTGAIGFDYTENCDCDFTPINFFDLDMMEEYDQISQEIRIVSPENQTVEWLAGVFYQSYEQTFDDLFNIAGDSMLVPVLQQAAASDEQRTALAGLAGTGIQRGFEQSSDTHAVFAEATWNVTDDFRMTLGGRYTEESKDASKVLNVVDITSNNAIVTSQTIAAIYWRQFLADTEQSVGIPLNDDGSGPVSRGHDLQGSRNEYALTPSFNIAYDVSEDVMTYGKVSRGFKAGGFDPRSNVPVYTNASGETVSAFEFDEEEVTAFELGAKMRFAEGRSEVNVALFRMDYDDLQISQFDGAVGFNVGNANETRVEGFEIDGRWRMSEHVTASYGAAYLDFEYLDFENGNCHYPSTGADLCDYSGERGVYTPELTLNAALEYVRSLQHGLLFVSSLDMQWVDEHQVHVNLDPRGVIDPHTMVSMRVGVEADRWELALLGRNLLNEEVITYSANIPLSATISGANSHYSFVRRPRTVALEGTFKF